MSDFRLPYGIKDNEMIHISQAESGLACGCVCPLCNERLVAKKGNIKEHHFAHYSTETCTGALETALHLAAKEIIQKQKRIALPYVEVCFQSGSRPIYLAPHKAYEVNSVCVEKKLGNIVPDLILDVNGQMLLVEIFVTHGVDSEKLRRIKELGISAIEIDVSSAPRDLPIEALSEIILNRVENKKWLNNERVNSVHQYLMSETVRKEVVKRGYSYRVEKCPVKMSKWNNKYIKNVDLYECLDCEYCLETDHNPTSLMKYIRCIGHTPDVFNRYK